MSLSGQGYVLWLLLEHSILSSQEDFPGRHREALVPLVSIHAKGYGHFDSQIHCQGHKPNEKWKLRIHICCFYMLIEFWVCVRASEPQGPFAQNSLTVFLVTVASHQSFGKCTFILVWLCKVIDWGIVGSQNKKNPFGLAFFQKLYCS